MTPCTMAECRMAPGRRSHCCAEVSSREALTYRGPTSLLAYSGNRPEIAVSESLAEPPSAQVTPRKGML